ncbi:uncharacterized protein MYCFIDRAFT_173943 [Pseudocercospora fijiensis CIRAD86]|uniref:Amidohydrolase-related domain-containing protein n=1 Tax=Pseudocercospora fijiensis (strain CIRAD86) TaxID=383855 RepID=M3B6W6_PSEFD|nr:uncharacterized protein MYCFIDRAFT_173943 [Pseudocercospora fijiensis CIRAD86]EME85078.1 hypothetical protein MYCFIDRAFT_173943 [Pseudocercospora fijiensis CIRAD86]
MCSNAQRRSKSSLPMKMGFLHVATEGRCGRDLFSMAAEFRQPVPKSYPLQHIISMARRPQHLGMCNVASQFNHGMMDVNLASPCTVEAGTARGPETLGPQASLSGQLKEGHDADFIAVSHSPLDDIAVLAKPKEITYASLINNPAPPFPLVYDVKLAFDRIFTFERITIVRSRCPAVDMIRHCVCCVLSLRRHAPLALPMLWGIRMLGPLSRPRHVHNPSSFTRGRRFKRSRTPGGSTTRFLSRPRSRSRRSSRILSTGHLISPSTMHYSTSGGEAAFYGDKKAAILVSMTFPVAASTVSLFNQVSTNAFVDSSAAGQWTYDVAPAWNRDCTSLLASDLQRNDSHMRRRLSTTFPEPSVGACLSIMCYSRHPRRNLRDGATCRNSSANPSQRVRLKLLDAWSLYRMLLHPHRLQPIEQALLYRNTEHTTVAKVSKGICLEIQVVDCFLAGSGYKQSPILVIKSGRQQGSGGSLRNQHRPAGWGSFGWLDLTDHYSTWSSGICYTEVDLINRCFFCEATSDQY